MSEVRRSERRVMKRFRSIPWPLVVMVLLLWAPVGASAKATADGNEGSDEFERRVARVDQALRTNPRFVPKQALYSCQDRRALAYRLYRIGQDVRANRSLTYCFNLLGISEDSVAPAPDPKLAEHRRESALARVKQAATSENDRAGALEGDAARGLAIYRECAACHTPEGWGMPSGIVPQLSGQHRTVVIKQLADIRAGYRKNQIMAPYANVETIGGAQAIADVAAYIDTLEISVENGKGDGKDLELGASLYAENCARCHGARGEGDATKSIPRIQAQHFGYLVTQFEMIRSGERKNADPEMVAQIANLDARDVAAVMDHVSRLTPPDDLTAPPGWRNPDFMRPPKAE